MRAFPHFTGAFALLALLAPRTPRAQEGAAPEPPGAPVESAAGLTAPGEGVPDEPAAREPRVRLELLASVETVTPGLEFELAARLALPRGWHVYWENPGDSGVATRLAFEAPDGFAVDTPRFPGPERIEQPGGIVSFGYEDELVVFATVRAPAELEPGRPLAFGVRASWFVCRGVCFAQEGAARLVVPASFRGADGEPRPAAERLLARWRPRLPVPLEAVPGARVEAAGSGASGSDADGSGADGDAADESGADGNGAGGDGAGGGPGGAVALVLPAAREASFFPGPAAPLDLEPPRLERGDDGVRLVFTPPASGGAVSGLVRLEGEGLPRYVAIALAPPRAPRGAEKDPGGPEAPHGLEQSNDPQDPGTDPETPTDPETSRDGEEIR